MIGCAFCWLEDGVRSAAENMAVDEYLTQTLEANDRSKAQQKKVQGVLRTYDWAEPVISFGYFDRVKAVREGYPAMPLMRRWTGGGRVEHRGDFPFSLVIPGNFSPGNVRKIYHWIHSRVLQALQEVKISGDLKSGNESGADCFQSPVESDIILTPTGEKEKKIVGGAMRRLRHGILYQGTIQQVALPQGFAAILAKHIGCIDTWESPLDEENIASLVTDRYGKSEWLELR